MHNSQHYELKGDHVVGWRNYFDLKQAETGAHYVAVMEKWRVWSWSDILPVRKERRWSAGEQERG